MGNSATNCNKCGRFVGNDGFAYEEGCTYSEGDSDVWLVVLCGKCKVSHART